MNIHYLSWSEQYIKTLSEESYVRRLDTANRTKYFEEFKKGATTRQIAQWWHQNRQYYDVFVETDQHEPFAFLEINDNFMGVNFLDEAHRLYLNYTFTEVRPGQLFMSEAFFFDFKTEEAPEEWRRLHFLFSQTGEVRVQEYLEEEEKIKIYQSNTSFEVNGLYETYPAFGQYDPLLQPERNLPLP